MLKKNALNTLGEVEEVFKKKYLLIEGSSVNGLCNMYKYIKKNGKHIDIYTFCILSSCVARNRQWTFCCHFDRLLKLN